MDTVKVSFLWDRSLERLKELIKKFEDLGSRVIYGEDGEPWEAEYNDTPGFSVGITD